VALLRLLLESLADKDDVDMVEDDPSLSHFGEIFSERMLRYAVNLIAFLKMPSVLFSLSVMKAIDQNQIHPEKLTGKKVNAQMTIPIEMFTNWIKLVFRRE
jgi:hypothetical protein